MNEWMKGIIGAAITYGCTEEAYLGIGKFKLSQNGLANVEAEAAFGLELLFTFFVVFFVLSVTDPKKRIEPYAKSLGYGIAVWVCHVWLVSVRFYGGIWKWLKFVFLDNYELILTQTPKYTDNAINRSINQKILKSIKWHNNTKSPFSFSCVYAQNDPNHL